MAILLLMPDGWGFHEAPDVNKSDLQISRVGDDIYLGLTEIKYVGKGAAAWVIDHRPNGVAYESYQDFVEIHEAAIKHHKAWRRWHDPSVPSQICNARAIRSLMQAGAFDTITERDIPFSMRAELEQDCWVSC